MNGHHNCSVTEMHLFDVCTSRLLHQKNYFFKSSWPPPTVGPKSLHCEHVSIFPYSITTRSRCMDCLSVFAEVTLPAVAGVCLGFGYLSQRFIRRLTHTLVVDSLIHHSFPFCPGLQAHKLILGVISVNAFTSLRIFPFFIPSLIYFTKLIFTALL